MAATSTWTQTETAQGVEKGQLRAIIYYSDRSWSNVVVFGSKTVAKAAGKAKPWGTPQVTQKNKGELPEVVPADEGYVREASEYGLPNGKVLLVSGHPPGN